MDEIGAIQYSNNNNNNDVIISYPMSDSDS